MTCIIKCNDKAFRYSIHNSDRMCSIILNTCSNTGLRKQSWRTIMNCKFVIIVYALGRIHIWTYYIYVVMLILSSQNESFDISMCPYFFHIKWLQKSWIFCIYDFPIFTMPGLHIHNFKKLNNFVAIYMRPQTCKFIYLYISKLFSVDTSPKYF